MKKRYIFGTIVLLIVVFFFVSILCGLDKKDEESHGESKQQRQHHIKHRDGADILAHKICPIVGIGVFHLLFAGGEDG